MYVPICTCLCQFAYFLSEQWHKQVKMSRNRNMPHLRKHFWILKPVLLPRHVWPKADKPCWINLDHESENIRWILLERKKFLNQLGIVHKIQPILQFHWLKITSSFFALVHQLGHQDLRPCVSCARDPSRVCSPLRGTDTDRLLSPKATSLLVVIYG